MTERIRYSIRRNHIGERLTLEVPEPIVNEAMETHGSLGAQMEELERVKALDIDRSASVIIGLNARVLGRAVQFEKRQRLMVGVRDVVALLTSHSALETDSWLRLNMGGLTKEGVIPPIEAMLRWPRLFDDELRQIGPVASEKMRNMAKALRYPLGLSAESRRQRMGARISRRDGVVLQTDLDGRRGLLTDIRENRQGDSYVPLHSSNLYSPEEQLICLTGLVAIAEICELATHGAICYNQDTTN